MRPRIAILANVPVWTLPGLGHLHRPGHYATWLEPLVPAFSQVADLDLHWVTMCKEAAEPLTVEAHGQTIHVLPRRSMGKSILTGYLGERRQVREKLREIGPALVHAWGSEDVYGMAGAQWRGGPKLFTLQGCLTHYRKLMGGPALFRIQSFYEPRTIRSYRHATAESPAARELLLGLHPALDVRLVDYGVPPAFFDTPWNPAPQPEALFLGSLTERKGLRDLLQAAANPDLGDLRIAIAGDGPLRQELEATAPPNVEWLGKCDRSEVVRRLSRAWCLVIPTHADTGPTVIKEARVMGLPVITTTAAGAACYIREGRNGFVVPPRDPVALAAALKRCCASRENAMAMGREAWDEDREVLSPSTTASKFAAIYRDLLATS